MGCLLRVYRLIIVDFLSSVSCSMSCYMTAKYRECTVLTPTIYMFQIFVLMMLACILYPPWYLLEVNCVKFILEFACFQGRKLSRNRLCTVGFTITSGDVTGTGVGIVTALAFPLIMQCRYAMCFSGIFSPVNTEKMPRGSPVRARYGVSFVDS